jgi:hypothetical protein
VVGLVELPTVGESELLPQPTAVMIAMQTNPVAVSFGEIAENKAVDRLIGRLVSV